MVSPDGLRLEEATPETIDQVAALLAANGLPNGDVRAKIDCFYLGYDGTNWIAVGGIERRGADGLLRSIVVKDSRQSEGFGTALCGALEEQARGDGIEQLYLLTTTAAPFFRQLGYQPITRDAVPAAIRQTDEFTDYCPDSAACMHKDLGDLDSN